MEFEVYARETNYNYGQIIIKNDLAAVHHSHLQETRGFNLSKVGLGYYGFLTLNQLKKMEINEVKDTETLYYTDEHGTALILLKVVRTK